MSDSQLAIYGGSKGVTQAFRERWRVAPWPALGEILWHGVRDITTRATADGPVREMERRFTALTDTQFAITMNSGTATLHSAYMALGIRPGDEVLVPAYTWFASVAPMLVCGGVPVFCDVDERTLTIDPDDIEHRITPRTKAITVVHIWGNPCEMDRITEIAERRGLALIEDASHAHGATYRGRPIGSFGDIACFSMRGAKPVSGGELGMVVTDDPVLHDRMLALAHNGRTGSDLALDTYAGIDDIAMGLKYRPHLYGALLAKESLKRLPRLNRLRRRNHEILRQELEGCAAIRKVENLPDAVPAGLMDIKFKYDRHHAGGWSRAAFVEAARAEGVPIQVDPYTLTGREARVLHEAPLFRDLDLSAMGGALPLVDARRMHEAATVKLPVAEKLTEVSEDFVRQCARAMRKVVDAAARIQDLRTGS